MSLGTVGAVTISDSVAGVGPVKTYRVKVVGDGAYATGGSLGFADKLCALLGEALTVVGAVGSGPNGDAHLEYTPKGPKRAASVVASTDLFTSTAHALASADPVQFYTDDPGDNAAAAKLPAGVVAGTTYYVIASGLTANAFKVSATLGGSTIDVTDAGGSFQVQRQDTLLNRVMSTGVESATADQSASTFGLLVTAY